MELEIATTDFEPPKDADKYPLKAREIVASIIDARTLELAELELIAIKGLRRKIKDGFGAICERTHAAWKAATSMRANTDRPFEESEEILTRGISAFKMREEARLRVEEQERLLLATKQAEQAKMAAVDHFVKNGDLKAAETILNESTIVSVARPVEQKSEKVSYGATWNAEVQDLKLLLREIIDGKAPISLIDIKQGELKRWVNMQKTESPCRGVRAWMEYNVKAKAGVIGK